MTVNFPRPITVTRFNAGAYTLGVWTPPTVESAPITINGNLQPAGRMLSAMQGTVNDLGKQSSDGGLILRSNEEVLTADKSDAKKADRLSYEGQTYEVISRSYRDNVAGLEHWISNLRVVDSNADDGKL